MALTPISKRLREIREARDWSREKLSHEAYNVDQDGTSVAQITAIERGSRRASAATILALAEVLGMDPDEFPEYRLAVARHLLDEEQVGLEQAVRNLESSGLRVDKVTPAEMRKHSRAAKVKRAKATVKRTRN